MMTTFRKNQQQKEAKLNDLAHKVGQLDIRLKTQEKYSSEDPSSFKIIQSVLSQGYKKMLEKILKFLENVSRVQSDGAPRSLKANHLFRRRNLSSYLLLPEKVKFVYVHKKYAVLNATKDFELV